MASLPPQVLTSSGASAPVDSGASGPVDSASGASTLGGKNAVSELLMDCHTGASIPSILNEHEWPSVL